MRELLKVPGAALIAVISVESGASDHGAGAARSFPSRIWLQRVGRAGGLRPVSLTLLEQEAEPIPARLEGEAGSRTLDMDPRAREALRAMELDFVMCFNLSGPCEPLASLAREGAWAFDFDLSGKGGAPLLAFRSLLRQDKAMRVRLIRMASDQGHDTVMAEGRFGVDRRSVSRTAARFLSEITLWPARACKAPGSSGGLPELRQTEPDPGQRRLEASRFRPVELALRIVWRRLAFAWSRLARHPQWNVGLIDAPIQTVLAPDAFPAIQWFPLQGRRSFLADPFGLVRGGHATILCERFDYGEGRGSICEIGISNGGFEGQPRDVMRSPLHLSYPYLVEDEGEVYCVPETSQAREISLFRAESFPDSWRKVGVLIPGIAAVDTTILRHGGRWWIFCTEGDRLPDERLLAFHSDRLEGPWNPHERNPVKIDIGSARPGGTPFEHDGEIFRPAQDCSGTYGGRIVINRLIRLTPGEFAEETVAVLEPKPNGRYPAGRHTLSALGSRTLVDGHRFIFVGSALRGFLKIWARDWSAVAIRFAKGGAPAGGEDSPGKAPG